MFQEKTRMDQERKIMENKPQITPFDVKTDDSLTMEVDYQGKNKILNKKGEHVTVISE